MVYAILDEQGAEINRIDASADFMAAQYPDGNYAEIPQPVAPKRNGLSGNEFYALFSIPEQGLWFDFVQSGNLPAPVPDEVRRALATAQGRLIPALTGGGVDLDNPLVGPALDAMQAAGIIAEGRKAQVLAGLVVGV
jgi:hypothetical protein